MNQIERVEGDNYALRLWSDAIYEVSTIAIKNLLNLVTPRLEIQLEIDAHYYHVERNWRVRFRYLERQSFEQNLDHSQLVCANAMFLERLSNDISDRIRRTVSNDENQTWIIVQDAERIVAGIHQGGRSITFVLSEITQEFNYPGQQRIEIEAWNLGNATITGESVEVGGMLLQGVLLEWLEVGESCQFRFCPNTHRIDRIERVDELDGTRITFTTRPRTARLASFERIRQMLADGQIEIPRSGYFDQYLCSLPRIGGRVEVPYRRRDRTPLEPEQHTASLEFGYFALPRDTAEAITRSADTIGDRTCKYNALSRHLRCTANPCGPCEGCTHYEKT